MIDIKTLKEEVRNKIGIGYVQHLHKESNQIHAFPITNNYPVNILEITIKDNDYIYYEAQTHCRTCNEIVNFRGRLHA